MRDSHKCRTLKVAPVTRCICAVIADAVVIDIIITVVTAITLIVRCVRVVGLVVSAKKDGQRICPGR